MIEDLEDFLEKIDVVVDISEIDAITYPSGARQS